MPPPSTQDVEQRDPQQLVGGPNCPPPKPGSRRLWPQIHVNPSLNLNQRTQTLILDLYAVKQHLETIPASSRASNSYLTELCKAILDVLEGLLGIGASSSVKEELGAIHALLRRQSEENNITRLSLESLQAQLNLKTLNGAHNGEPTASSSSGTTHYKMVRDWAFQGAAEGVRDEVDRLSNIKGVDWLNKQVDWPNKGVDWPANGKTEISKIPFNLRGNDLNGSDHNGGNSSNSQLTTSQASSVKKPSSHEDLRLRVKLPLSTSNSLRRYTPSSLRDYLNETFRQALSLTEGTNGNALSNISGQSSKLQTSQQATQASQMDTQTSQPEAPQSVTPPIVGSASILPTGALELHMVDVPALERVLHNQAKWLPAIDSQAHLVVNTYGVLMHSVLTKSVPQMHKMAAAILHENPGLPEGTTIVFVAWINLRGSTKPKSSLQVHFSTPEAANMAIKLGLFYQARHHPCERYISGAKLMQCKRCTNFGHLGTHCPNKPRCVYCASAHEGRNCSVKSDHQRWSCANCGGKHCADSEQCPIIVKKRAINAARIKVTPRLYETNVSGRRGLISGLQPLNEDDPLDNPPDNPRKPLSFVNPLQDAKQDTEQDSNQPPIGDVIPNTQPEAIPEPKSTPSQKEASQTGGGNASAPSITKDVYSDPSGDTSASQPHIQPLDLKQLLHNRDVTARKAKTPNGDSSKHPTRKSLKRKAVEQDERSTVSDVLNRGQKRTIRYTTRYIESVGGSSRSGAQPSHPSQPPQSTHQPHLSLTEKQASSVNATSTADSFLSLKQSQELSASQASQITAEASSENHSEPSNLNETRD